MTQEMQRLAVYDMDRTVTVRGTYTPFLLFMARRIAPWRLLLAPLVIFVMGGYILKLVSRKRLKEINMALLMGNHLPPQKLQPHVEAYADHVIAHNLHPGARQRIAADQAEGYRVALCTASYTLYVTAIAARVGIAADDVIGTELETDSAGQVIPRIVGENCYDEAKVGRIIGWMNAIGVTRSQSYMRAYSDHISDAPMLEMADEPFAANPSVKLRALAEARSWPILDFSSH